jgi:hypothetical protein
MLNGHGWAVDFGANTFLVGKAIERCREALDDFFVEASKGRLLPLQEVREALKRRVSGAVANYQGDEYAGYYPLTDGQLVFGAQAIDVDDFVRALLTATDASALFVGGD